VRIRPDFAVAYESLGHAYRHLGEARLSLHAFERSVELNPGVPNAQYNLGLELLESGRPREALVAIGEAVRLRPDFALALVGLANAHAALGDREAALGAGERALQLAREQGDTEFALQIDKHLEQFRDAPVR
jgi:tetratricopeptide (TPR) repeat protein